MGGAKLALEGVGKAFGALPALTDISMTAEPGSFTTLLGASGSGKSTTLMLIAGFLAPDRGRILLNDASIIERQPHKRDFGVVFQNYALFPHMTVFDNVAFPLKMRGQSRHEIGRRVEAALDLVKLEGVARRFPRQLSGGQQQRVALARAIVADPPLLLMDEPLSALDKQLREHMQIELKSIQRRLGVTVIYVTHDQTEALVMSDRIAVMHNGRIEQIGTAREIYDRPASRYVTEFIGDTNFFQGVVQPASCGACAVRCDADLAFIANAAPVRVGEQVGVAVRPERLRIVDAACVRNRVDGVVEETVYLGDALRLRVRLDGGRTLTAKLGRDTATEALRGGDRVMLGCDPADVILVPLAA